MPEGFNVTTNLWFPWYRKIVAQLGLDVERDVGATKVLSELLEGKDLTPSAVKNRLEARPVLVFGAGPSLARNISEIDVNALSRRWVVIAADGATTALVKLAGRTPDLIVTDLDGWMPDILAAHRSGSVVVVHGHGDNIPRLRRYVPNLSSALGTTQVEPTLRVYNFGGFTDGDRAVFLAYAMGAETIVLAGMDLGRVVGSYSKKRVRSTELKLTKLRICKQLLEWLASKVEVQMLNVTWYGESIHGFKDVHPSELSGL